MNKAEWKRTFTPGRIVAFVLIVLVGAATAMLTFTALGKPQFPVLLALVALFGFIGFEMLLEKAVSRWPSRLVGCCLDVVFGVGAGLVFMLSQETGISIGWVERGFEVMVLVAVFLAGINYFRKRHPDPHHPAPKH